MIAIESTERAHLQASTEGVQSFCRTRLGLSVHWGVYALLGRGE